MIRLARAPPPALSSCAPVEANRALTRRLLILCALGLWAAAVPYLGPPLGFELDVADRVEVVDHVVPGAVVLVACLGVLAYSRAGRGSADDVAPLAGIGLALLAGFWVTATHVPLIAEAARGESPWGATLWHNSAGLPLLLVAGVLLVGPLLGRGD